jgi:hypothetical protein
MTLRISEKGSLPQSSSVKGILRALWRQRMVAVKAVVVVYVVVSLFVFTVGMLGLLSYSPVQHGNYDNATVERTYVTDGISPLNELDAFVRFYKMHSKMPKSFSDNLKPYYIRAAETPEQDDITVTAFVTENRFDDLKRLAEIWQGPISAIFHISSKSFDKDNPTVHKVLEDLDTYLKKHPIIAKHADIHVIANYISLEKPETFARPTNFHHNVARFFARTEFIFYLSHDTWPTIETREEIRKHKKLLLANDVISVPTFTFQDGATGLKMPKNRNAVIEMVKAGELGLQDDGWELNRGPTCYSFWQKGELYKIDDFELHYRPNFVSRKGGNIPWCTERFDDNKAACLYQMYISGSDIWVLPKAFLIRRNFNSESHLIRPSESRWEKAINSRLYTKYYREACVHYARQFVLMGEWNSPRSAHLKQECNRVLTNWGKGLVDA